MPSNSFCDSETTIGGKTGQAHIIQDDGTTLRPRAYLNFTGSGVSSADSGGKTVVTIGGGGGTGDSVTLVTDSFGNILSTSDSDVQTAMETIDDSITSSAPANAEVACSPSTLAFQSGYLYVCVSENSWERVAIATWNVTDVMLLSDGTSKVLLSDGTSFILIRP